MKVNQNLNQCTVSISRIVVITQSMQKDIKQWTPTTIRELYFVR